MRTTGVIGRRSYVVLTARDAGIAVVEGDWRRQPTRAFVTDAGWYDDRAKGLLEMHRGGLPNALEQIRTWHPAFARSTHGEIAAAPFTIDDARLVYARQHRSASWSSFVASIAGVARDPFSTAFEAAQRKDDPTSEERFREILAANPSIADVRGTNGNTLLNLATALENRAAVHELLAAGAEAARALSSVAIVPDNLRINAGLGRVDRLRELAPADDGLAADAAIGRGFYRVHSGFPVWRPSNDDQEMLNEALVWAARMGEVEAMAFLVQRGADVDADPYRGSPLLAATAHARLGAMDWLLDHGADVNRLATFGGPGYGTVTALHVAAADDRVDAATLLLARGADPTIKDLVYSASPAGWAEHNNAPGVAALLRGRSSRQNG